MVTHKKKKVVHRYSSKEAAQRKAAAERAKGRQATVRYDRRTGEWIVEVIILLAVLSIFGSLLRHD